MLASSLLRDTLPGLPAPSRTPIWNELDTPIQIVRMLRSPGFRDEHDACDAPVVLLIPGLGAGGRSLSALSGWLRRRGYRTMVAPTGITIDCSQRLLDRIAPVLLDAHRASGSRIAIVGQSRGGALARALAVRHADVVSGIVCLGSPLDKLLRVHPALWATVAGLGAIGRAGAPGFLSINCWARECCTGYRAASTGPFPPEVGFVSVFSRRDGLVDWRGCLDENARHVEVRSSHFGMGFDPDVFRVVDSALRAFA